MTEEREYPISGWRDISILLAFLLSSTFGFSVDSMPPNPECAAAIEVFPILFSEDNWTVSNLDQSESLPGCAGIADDDIWFKFIAQSPNDVILVESDIASLNIAVELFEDCNSISLQCFDNYGIGEGERGMYSGLTPGVEYFYRIYSLNVSQGAEETVRTQVKTFIDGALHPTYCEDFDFTLGQSIYALRNDLNQLYTGNPVPVTGYDFQFENSLSGELTNYHHPNYEPYIQLVNVPGLAYDNSYNVSVRHRVSMNVNGQNVQFWSPFGSACILGMNPEIPTTQLLGDFCPSIQDLDYSSWIGAESRYGASKYRFTFTGGGQELVEETTSYGLTLSELGIDGSGLQYGGVIYEVEVENFVRGEWSEKGSACTISMAWHPAQTALQDDFCNQNYIDNTSNSMLAQYIVGATDYEFRFHPMDTDGSDIHEIRPSLSLAFHQVDNDFITGNYMVSVRAKAGGQWGDFFESCPVFITGQPGIEIENSESILLSNLNEILNISNFNNAGFELRNTQDNSLLVSWRIIDTQGKTVHSGQSVNLNPGFNRIELSRQLSPGLYILQLENTSSSISNSILLTDD